MYDRLWLETGKGVIEPCRVLNIALAYLKIHIGQLLYAPQSLWRAV